MDYLIVMHNMRFYKNAIQCISLHFEFAILILIMLVAAAALQNAGLNMNLFYLVVGAIITIFGVIDALELLELLGVSIDFSDITIR